MVFFLILGQNMVGEYLTGEVLIVAGDGDQDYNTAAFFGRDLRSILKPDARSVP